MTGSLCSLAVQLGAAAACADAPSDRSRNQIVAAVRPPASSGYLADLEVSLGGVTRHGRVIVTPDGRVHVEHLDEEARRWVREVIRQDCPTSKGWYDRPRRAGPVRRVWGRLGPCHVLTEVHVPAASLKLSRHRLLPAR